MKKIITIILVMMFLVLSMQVTCLNSVAQTSFEDLWQAKLEYEKDMSISTGNRENTLFIYYELNWSFLLYTEQGKKLTYVTEPLEHSGRCDNDELATIRCSGSRLRLTSPQLREIADKASVYRIDVGEDEVRIFKGSALRELVKELKLTKDDIVNGFHKMKTEPQSARNLLSFLSDEQFNYFVAFIEQYTCPPDFILDAAFWDNDIEGNMLLSRTGTVYLPEYDGAIVTDELFGLASPSVADFDKFFEGVDLTTTAFQYYFENLKHYVYVQNPLYDSNYDGTVLPKMAYLEAEVARQLAAKETVDSAVYSAIVLALAIPALAATLILRRKRKI